MSTKLKVAKTVKAFLYRILGQKANKRTKNTNSPSTLITENQFIKICQDELLFETILLNSEKDNKRHGAFFDFIKQRNLR
jgi:hypothetical protein